MRKAISTPDAPQAIGPYSQAIEANGMLFISGQIPLDPKTGALQDGGIGQQTKLVMENIGAILKAAGYGFENVVKTTCLLADISDFAGMNEVYAEYFKENAPARSAFAAKDLPKGARLEIEAIAVKTVDESIKENISKAKDSIGYGIDSIKKMASDFFSNESAAKDGEESSGDGQSQIAGMKKKFMKFASEFFEGAPNSASSNQKEEEADGSQCRPALPESGN